VNLYVTTLQDHLQMKLVGLHIWGHSEIVLIFYCRCYILGGVKFVLLSCKTIKIFGALLRCITINNTKSRL
jgi:hypothetical protein